VIIAAMTETAENIRPLANLLSGDELQAYAQDGIVVPDYQLSADHLLSLRSTLDRLLKDNPGIRPERLVSAHIEGRNAEGVRGSADFLALARDKGIVDRVSQLIGDDVILWGCQIFCKPGGDGMAVPWHQDGHYWPIRPLATCTVWVALDDSSVENGCLRVVPGSHRHRQLQPHLRDAREDIVLNQRLDDALVDEGCARAIELKAGQMSMHDVYLVHGSHANRSARRRAGVAIRYMPGTSLLDRGPQHSGAASGYLVDFSSRPLWLLRGRDRTGRNNFQLGHPTD